MRRSNRAASSALFFALSLCTAALAAAYTETPLPDGSHIPANGQRKYYESQNRDHLNIVHDVVVNDLSSKDDYAITPDILQSAIDSGAVTLEKIWSSYVSINLGHIHVHIDYAQYRVHFMRGPQAGNVTPGGLVIGKPSGTTGQTLTWIISQPYGTTRGFLNAVVAALSPSTMLSHDRTTARKVVSLKPGALTITHLPNKMLLITPSPAPKPS